MVRHFLRQHKSVQNLYSDLSTEKVPYEDGVLKLKGHMFNIFSASNTKKQTSLHDFSVTKNNPGGLDSPSRQRYLLSSVLDMAFSARGFNHLDSSKSKLQFLSMCHHRLLVAIFL